MDYLCTIELALVKYEAKEDSETYNKLFGGIGPLRGTGSKIWCGWFDGNEKSERVQEKCGFIWHHTRKDVYCELMGDIRTGQISCLTRGDWLSQSKA